MSTGAAVLIQNDAGAVVDFAAASQGFAKVDQITSPFPIPASAWRGDPAVHSFIAGSAVQRRGARDTGSAADWVQASPNLGVLNEGMTLPFDRGYGAVSFSLSQPLEFDKGIYTDEISFHEEAENAWLSVTAANVQPSTNRLFNVVASAPGDDDGDGLPNDWEVTYGLGIDTGDAEEDRDGDGANNLQELFAGTSPIDRWSAPEFKVERASESTLRFTFTCARDRTWSLQSSSDISLAEWSEVAASTSDGQLQSIELGSDTELSGFFRLRID